MSCFCLFPQSTPHMQTKPKTGYKRPVSVSSITLRVPIFGTLLSGIFLRPYATQESQALVDTFSGQFVSKPPYISKTFSLTLWFTYHTGRQHGYSVQVVALQWLLFSVGGLTTYSPFRARTVRWQFIINQGLKVRQLIVAVSSLLSMRRILPAYDGQNFITLLIAMFFSRLVAFPAN